MALVPLFARPQPRLRVTPDDPDAVVVERPKGTRRPHTDATVARVRRLVEQTTLTFDEMQKKSGVGRATICRWARDQNWTRPFNAPRATDRVPSARASQKLKLRRLAERLRMLAERYMRELEEAPAIDVDKLMEAMQVLKMARLEAMGRRRRRTWPGETRTGAQVTARETAIRTALHEMRRGGVDLDRAPQEALDMLTDAATPVEDNAAFKERGMSRRRAREHRWMLERG